MEILTLSHVSKSFGGHQVLDDLSFSVPQHSVFGFIGQNGAGKTTTMKLILGLLRADSGQILLSRGERSSGAHLEASDRRDNRPSGRHLEASDKRDNRPSGSHLEASDRRDNRPSGSHLDSQLPVTYGQNNTNRYIGYLPDVPEFYGFLTPAEYLKLMGRIAGMSEAEIAERSRRLLDLVGLGESQKRIRGFSRGMKQRLGIAQALLGRPRLLICDEPTSALDPVGRKEILDLLSAVKDETTVLFSTHILSDVERICDEIALLHQGKIAFRGTLDTLRHMHGSSSCGAGFKIEFSRPEGLRQFVASYPGGRQLGHLELVFEEKQEKDMMYAIHLLSEKDIPIRKIEMCEFTLEHLFMSITGNEAEKSSPGDTGTGPSDQRSM